MEKDNSRAGSQTNRANKKAATGNTPENGGAASKHGTTSASADTVMLANGPTARATEGRAHMTTGARAAQSTKASLPRTMQDAFLDERNDVLSVINELEDQLDRYEEIRQSLEHDLTKKGEQLQTAQQRVQELEWQVVTSQTRVEALEQVRQELTLLEEELGEANGRTQRMAEQLKRVEKENTQLNADLKAANKQLGELWMIRKERDGLRTDVRNLRTQIEQIEQANREANEERAQLQVRLQETLTAFDVARKARHESERDLRVANDRNQELQRVQEAVDEKLDTLRSEKKGMQAQIAHLERENARLVEQHQFYECELNSLRGMNHSAETALTNVKKAFTEVRVALSETKSRVRRRTMENWPRVNTTLCRIPTEDDAPEAKPDAAMAPATIGENELGTARLGETDADDSEPVTT